MEPEIPLPCSQDHTTGPYPEPDSSSPHFSHLYFPKIHLSIIFPSTSMSSEWFFPFRIFYQSFLLSPMRDTYTAISSSLI